MNYSPNTHDIPPCPPTCDPLTASENLSSSSLKRSHHSAIRSTSSDQPVLKYAKRSPSHASAPSKHGHLSDEGRSRRGRQEEEKDTNPTRRDMQPSPPENISLLVAAATAVSQGKDKPSPRMPASSRGPGASTISVSLSPEVGRARSRPGRSAISNTGRSDEAQLLHSIPLIEYLQLDERPTFIVDITDNVNLNTPGLNLVFANTALKNRTTLFEHVQGRSEDPTLLLDVETPFSDFKAWALSSPTEPNIVLTFPFTGWVWQGSLLRKKLKVIRGRQHPSSPPLMADGGGRPGMQQYHGLGSVSTSSSGGARADAATQGYFDIPPRTSSEVPRTLSRPVTEAVTDASQNGFDHPSPIPNGDLANSEVVSGSAPEGRDQRVFSSSPLINLDNDLVTTTQKGYFDWTRLPVTPSLPMHIQFARGIDWAATSLGPIQNWSVELRGMCNLIMASPHPSAMYWGPDHIAIYNEAYVLLAGQKHPALMGARYRDAWSEIWDALEDVFDNAFKNAQATMKDDDCLFIMRNGFLEETYFSWSIIPLIGADGGVIGLYNPAFEKTRRKIAERRMLTLREIGERTAAARQVSQFWGLLLQGLEYNEYDAPMVLVYSLNEDLAESDVASSGSSGAALTKVCYLEGSLGIPPGHQAAPAVIEMKTGTKGFAASFRQALTTDRPIVLRVDDGSLDPALLENIEWRGFGDPSKIVVISPIHPTTGESTLGFLVMATNPRRPYDEDYDLFVQLLGRQLATSIASVVLFEDEIRKGEQAAQLAAQDRIELNNQLLARTQQAAEAENKFTRMAELAPVGIFIGNLDGKINFANDAWYNISSYPRDVPVDNEWIEYILDEDQAKVRELWNTMLEKRCAISLEFRFKTPWSDKLGNQGQTWVLTSVSPERDDDGRIRQIFGSMTDISAQKFAESLQTRRMEEAVELKRKQERYIDTTSHEMRNPLSAILQCADSITGSLSEMRDANGLTQAQQEILDLTIDSAQTITLCAQHQKRIVDDVLTLSKLDSAMMAVTPVDTRPLAVVHKVLKMFDAELKTADIRLDLIIDMSFTTHQIEWVRIDPHRLSQVLINLMTNAVKFTATQENRVIRMHIAASGEKPSQEDKWRLTYIPSRTHKDKDVTAAAEWGLGEPVYLHFAVQDTGRGLDELEKKQLFQRFSQASPRTHVTYGGSGLGLFISRELVELQGGEIGVASESGNGSIFAFYIKARRTNGDVSLLDDNPSTSAPHSRKGSRTTPLSGLTMQMLQSTPGASTGPSKSPASLRTDSTNLTTQSGPVHVLIVEDNLINQKVLAAQLRKIGCVVYVANHGGEAIDQIRKSRFYRDHVTDGVKIDVVLMDLEMPIMDGQTCARKLRDMQDTGELVAHVPVIAVTANARAEQIEMTLQSGIDDVVSKPFRLPELVPKMKDVLTKFQRAGEGS
ncbi:sensory transduction histidine kinase [Fonsecaea pedrosoi]|nr:sensory transduction histidine kinase [Fonsecaea pedrosoi]